jgi:hypothetical protein
MPAFATGKLARSFPFARSFLPKKMWEIFDHRRPDGAVLLNSRNLLARFFIFS